VETVEIPDGISTVPTAPPTTGKIAILTNLSLMEKKGEVCKKELNQEKKQLDQASPLQRWLPSLTRSR